MSVNSTDKLAQLISKRRKCLEQLRDVGRKQLELIAAGQMGDLLRLLAAKQQLLSAVELMEKELAPFQRENAEQRVWASMELRQRCAADAEACRALLAEVMEIEVACEQNATLQRDDVAGQLKTMTAAGRVRAAYLANG